MLKIYIHSVKKITSLLIVAASLLCVLFGQGTHFHDLAIHIGEHFDVHAHVHAHESHDEPMQADRNNEENKHQHAVSTASNIIGTLTSPIQVNTDTKVHTVISLVAESNLVNPDFDEIPFLFDLPPPRPAMNQYHLSSFSHRGPPIV